MKSFTRIAILAIVTLLGGCGLNPQKPSDEGRTIDSITRTAIKVTMPGGKTATIVANEQKLPLWLTPTDSMRVNFIVMGDVTNEQLAVVAETERACRIYTNTVTPSTLVAVISSGVLYAASGYIGLGLASSAFPHAVESEYAKYGGIAGALGGAANGVVNTGNKRYVLDNCAEVVTALFSKQGVPRQEMRVLRQ